MILGKLSPSLGSIMALSFIAADESAVGCHVLTLITEGPTCVYPYLHLPPGTASFVLGLLEVSLL